MKVKPILIKQEGLCFEEDIVINKTSGDMFVISRDLVHNWGKNRTHLEPYDIILVDTEAEIVEGDWYYECEYKTVLQCDIDQIKAETCSKVLYTTSKEVDLPLLSPQSILLLINYYNKFKCMPESVEVEEDMGFTDGRNFKDGDENDPDICKWILLTEEGEVDISISEVEEKLYTEEEVFILLDEYDKAKWGSSARKSPVEIANWFNSKKK